MPSFLVWFHFINNLTMDLVFATHNQHKVHEIRAIAGPHWNIVSLLDLGCTEEIPETADSLQGNALQKARFVKDRYGINCFADDTGLEIEALNGRPGIYSARYAGEHCSFADNMNKVLAEMSGLTNRKACFKTVIALLWDDKTYFFEGRIDGTIIEKPRGNAGFGYDPVFVPDGSDKTFAEMDESEKNRISHRGLAIAKLLDFLDSLDK